MSEDEIRGRNLVKDGRFPSGWRDHWSHDGTGNAVTFEDPAFGNYIMMNQRAVITQTIDAATFTEDQLKGATYRITFQYENYGEGQGAGVRIKNGSGPEDFIDLSGKKPNTPLADWNLYPSYKFVDVVVADKDFTLQMQGSELGGSSGLRMTDIDVQIHLVPLRLKSLQLDGKSYEVSGRVSV